MTYLISVKYVKHRMQIGLMQECRKYDLTTVDKLLKFM